jgi:cellulose synthase/poly-beta-1,6-N-acetylglucosamine synthase-like glycosyltransferase
LYPEPTQSAEPVQAQHIEEDQAVEKEHTVAIIGGGMACIATAHELVSRNFKVVILEKNATLRGVWSKAFHNSLDVPLSQFLGWELPKSFPKCPNELEVQAYLNQYVDKFRLRHLFRFNTSVSKVVNNPDGTFTIHTQHANGERQIDTFDELVFSTGMFSNPLVPRNSSTDALQSATVPKPVMSHAQPARALPAVPYAHSVASVSTGSSVGTEYTHETYEPTSVVEPVVDMTPAPFSLPEATPVEHSETYSDVHSAATSASSEIDAYGTFDPNYDMDESASIAAEPFNFNKDVPEFSEPDVISQPSSEASTVFAAKPPKCGIPDGNRPVYIPVAIDHPRNFHRDYADSLQLVGDHFTELMVVTMYNEHGDELARTLQGILENHENYVKSGGNWHDVVLCIVSDGVTKISESCLEFSQSFGLINQDDMEELEQPCDVHMWYSIPEVEKDSNALAANFPPLQILYILKEKNAGKLHSHMWAFNGIAPVCQPTYCFLIDVGTVPAERSIHMLYEEMEYNKNIGGCCGEITPVISCNALHWAQSCEYKISHVLDKAFESVFGFISVLPGAFSAYRYEAIEGRPLQKYFSSFQKKLAELGAFRANMYLAEDRILCFELICQKDRTWTLHYVKNALATTDAPPTLLELLKQRRRWLNGSFFAMIYVLMHIAQFWTDGGHSFTRKFWISCEFLFYALSTFLNWFMVGSLFICVYYTVKLGMLRDYYALVLFILIAYTFSILIQLVFALGHKPDSLEWVYQAIASSYAVLMILLLYTAIDYSLIHNPSWWYRGAFLITFGGYFVAGAMHGEFSVFLSYVIYFLLLPTFLTIFTLYSFCNIDDLSWGTKNADDMNDEERRAREKFKVFRTQVLMSWLSLNICLVLVLTLFDLNRPYIIALAFIGATFTGVKIIGSFCYLVEYCYKQAVRKRLVRQPKLDYGVKGGYEPVDYGVPAYDNPFDVETNPAGCQPAQ